MKKSLAQLIPLLSCGLARAAAVASSLLSPLALGGSGELDPTFGSGGRVSFEPGNVWDNANSVILQMDGRIVIAGQTTGRLLLARLEPDGSPDMSFGDAGIVTGAIGDGSANIVIQQRDGKLVVAGGGSFYGPLVLWRFNSNGTFDRDFGNRGSVVLASVGGRGARGLVQQADDKLVVVGESNEFETIFARFHPDGSCDATFGENGIVIVRFPSRTSSRATFANGLLQQPNGKLVVVGSQNLSDFGSPDSGVALARVTAEGEFDQTFGEDGIVEIPLRSLMTGYVQFTTELSAALQDDGKILIAGTAAVGGRFRGFILRLQVDGDPDPTFGLAGVVLVSPAAPHGVTIAPDGKILIAATVCSGSDYRVCDMTLMQHNANGSVNASFGTPIADFGSEREIRFSSPQAMTRQADGSLVVVGSSSPPADERVSLAIARFRSDVTGFAGLIGLTSTTCQCPDNGGPAEFVVRRTGGTKGAVAVDFETVDGSAVAGSDYVLQRGRLEWPDGDESTRKIVLALIDNSKTAPEAFTLRLSNPTGGAVLTTSIATVSITDSAPGPGRLGFLDPGTLHSVTEGSGAIRVAVFRSNGSTGPVSMDYATIAVTATPGLDFTAKSSRVTWADGETGLKFIDIEISDDDLPESDETFRIRLSNPTGGATINGAEVQVKIRDDDTTDEPRVELSTTEASIDEAGGSVVLTVVRQGAADGAVSVDYTTSSGTATAGTDFTTATGTLSWADGEATSKTISISITNDTIDETDETFTVRVSNPSAGARLGSISSQSVTIKDDDAPSGGGGSSTFSLAAIVPTVAEAIGSITFAVVRNVPSTGAVSVDYATVSGTATAGADFTNASGTLHWADGDSAAKTVAIDITNDITDESDETFSFTILNPSPGAGLGTNSTATVTIADDDVPAPAPKNSGGGSSDGPVLGLLLLTLVRRLAFAWLGIRDENNPGPRSSGG